MVQLYFNPSCSFCVRVLRYLEQTGIPYEPKEVGYFCDANRDALLKLGGKTQVPFLVDPERQVAMYESQDIIDYLREHYEGRGSEKSAQPPPEAG